MKIENRVMLNEMKVRGLKKIKPEGVRFIVGMDTCGIGMGADKLFDLITQECDKRNLEAMVTKVGCFGYCANEPIVGILLPNLPMVLYHQVELADIPMMVQLAADHKIYGEKVLGKIESWDHHTAKIEYGSGYDYLRSWDEEPFFKWQKKIVLRNAGLINPEDIEEYVAVGGYDPLYKALFDIGDQGVLDAVKASGLRGRGGAGFPTGLKWQFLKNSNADQKYLICNADEGDPGAYMNRNEIESDPHMLIEGMILGGFATGATKGLVYARAEYPLAIARLKKGIEQARAHGFLGEYILGSDFSFDIDIVAGAGAFVCGEETALIASMEGRAGRPKPRPPFPAEKGLWGKPTNINNVETWCNIPVIVARGGEWFRGTGTKESPGTKVFSLVGKIKNTGLVELPLGEKLETLIYGIGGGTGTELSIKAVQTGGPSGGCIPASLFSTPIDYESLTKLGAIMGSGGVVVMDQFNCMVDVAKYFLEFTTSESCGKCTPCREGLNQALLILKRITEGKGKSEDIDLLIELGNVITDTALCGLGQTACKPILTTIQYFREEYEEHIHGRHCPSGVCHDLFLAPCENSCPIHMNIPAFIQLMNEDRLHEAFESVYQDNPLPATTGRICHAHCRLICRRADVDEMVNQREIHRYISDTVYERGEEKPIVAKMIDEIFEKTGKHIAIVGAGPAGLTAAYYLARMGHQVTVYEGKPQGGGLLRYAIPEYRLPKKVLDHEIKMIESFGVKFVYNHYIGERGSLTALNDHHDALFMAIGAQQERNLGIEGENLGGVFKGITFLDKVAMKEAFGFGKSVVVVGGGNSALDAARTALRLGSKVTVVYRREEKDMPADHHEIVDAKAEGIEFIFQAAPSKIVGEDDYVTGIEVEKMILGDFDGSGRRRPNATGDFSIIRCDRIIFAVGEQINKEMLKNCGLEIDRWRLKVDPFSFKTDIDGIYGGGDLVLGPSTVAEAMGTGKKVARVIDTELMGEERFKYLFKTFDYNHEVPVEPQGGDTNQQKTLSVQGRIYNFEEVACGFSRIQAKGEASRCLRCDVQGCHE